MKRKVLTVGCGGIGERHIRVLCGMEGIEVSICDANQELLKRLTETYHIFKAYSAWKQIDLEQFDVVVIATPANLHVRMIMDALAAKCHVLCEKPLALSLEGIDSARELARKQNRLVGVAYVYRSMPGPRSLRERVISGEVGDIKNVVCVCGSNYPFFRPDYAQIYYSDPARGGGALHDAVSHMINYIEWCLGPVESIYSLARHLVLPKVEVEDTAACVMTFTDSDAMGTLSLNQFQYAPELMLEFVGTSGVLRFDGASHSVGVCREICGKFEWSESMLCSRDEHHKLQFENFFRSIDANEPLVCTLEDAEMTLRTILAAHESVKQNKPVPVR